MRIPSDFTPTIKIFIWIMAVLSMAIAILSIVLLCGVHFLPNVTPAEASIYLAASTLVAVFATCLATIHYKIDSTHLRLKMAFLDVLKGRIRIENILNIVKKDGNLYLSYLWKEGDPIIAHVVVRPKYYQKITSALMEKNPNIVYFDEDQKTV